MDDLRQPATGETSHAVSLPLEVISDPRPLSPRTSAIAAVGEKPYSPERQRDYVRLILTCGLLLILGYLVAFATIESASTPAHWTQTKEMLQIVLPALTGILGTVIGFYFGSTTAGNNSPSGDGS